MYPYDITLKLIKKGSLPREVVEKAVIAFNQKAYLSSSNPRRIDEWELLNDASILRLHLLSSKKLETPSRALLEMFSYLIADPAVQPLLVGNSKKLFRNLTQAEESEKKERTDAELLYSAAQLLVQGNKKFRDELAHIIEEGEEK